MLLLRSKQELSQQSRVALGQVPQSISQLLGMTPHRPAQVALGVQQAPAVLQTCAAAAQHVVPQAFPLAQQTPMSLTRLVQLVPWQQSLSPSQGAFSSLHVAWQTPATQTPEQQAASPPAVQSASAFSLHTPLQQI